MGGYHKEISGYRGEVRDGQRMKRSKEQKEKAGPSAVNTNEEE